MKEVMIMRIGDRAIVIDKASEFYGLTVVIQDKRVEPKPRPHTIYKVETADGMPPESYPFASVALGAEQLRLASRRADQPPAPLPEPSDKSGPDAAPSPNGAAGVPGLSPHHDNPAHHPPAPEYKDYFLLKITDVRFMVIDAEHQEHIEVERLQHTNIDEVAQNIARKHLHDLSDDGGVLRFQGNPVNYVLVETSEAPKCINGPVMFLYEIEKTERELETGVALEEEPKIVEMEQMTELTRTVSDRLKALIEKEGTSQRKLAKTLGIKPSLLSHYFSGVDMDYTTLTKAADYFQVSTDYLIGHAEEPAPVKPDTPDKRLLDLLDAKEKQIRELEHRLSNLKRFVERF